MSRESFDSVTGRWMPSGEYYALKAMRKASATRSALPAPMVIGDAQAYRSVITGEMIDGRRQHRDHLRAHGCVEVGNDFQEPAKTTMPSAGADIVRAMEQGPTPEMKAELDAARHALDAPKETAA